MIASPLCWSRARRPSQCPDRSRRHPREGSQDVAGGVRLGVGRATAKRGRARVHLVVPRPFSQPAPCGHASPPLDDAFRTVLSRVRKDVQIIRPEIAALVPCSRTLRDARRSRRVSVRGPDGRVTDPFRLDWPPIPVIADDLAAAVSTALDRGRSPEPPKGSRSRRRSPGSTATGRPTSRSILAKAVGVPPRRDRRADRGRARSGPARTWSGSRSPVPGSSTSSSRPRGCTTC